MFKVGDRVMNVNEYDSHKGEKGTIVEVQGACLNQYLVEYDNYINGHSGNDIVIGKDGYCWWEEDGTIEKIQKCDNMKILEIICKELGVEVGEEWQDTNGRKFKIDKEEGLLIWCDILKQWDTPYHVTTYLKLLKGNLKPKWKPKFGEKYYMPELNFEHPYDDVIWKEDVFDYRALERNIAFKTKEEAIECANAMLELAKNYKEEI